MIILLGYAKDARQRNLPHDKKRSLDHQGAKCFAPGNPFCFWSKGTLRSLMKADPSTSISCTLPLGIHPSLNRVAVASSVQ
ncbi:hypothetical protein PRBEI_2001866900 [Prionailurus iriomotensis]